MKKLYFALFLVAGAAFFWAIIELFEIRFARGDVYPPYSTLRTDPLGAKAFYESLARLDQLGVSRNEIPLDRFKPPVDSTLFCIGTTGLEASETEIVSLERFVSAGGRLVIAFYPQAEETFLVERPKKNPPSPTPAPEEAPVGPKYLSTREVTKRWDFKLGAKGELTDSRAERANDTGTDREISWHSALHFDKSGPPWKSIYTANNLPVVIERQMGEGTIVLAADSYLFSNEAMRRERHPALLTWIVGKNSRVIFDETHLGIHENPGVSALMRRFHLGGLLAGLVVFALLAVWKNSARLIPITEGQTETEEIVLGRESFTGLVNLLRRNIAPAELIPVAVEQWSKLLPSKSGSTQKDRIREIIENPPRDIAATYRQIATTLRETKWKPLNRN